MGDKKKVPEDMGLFRSSVEDVRPLTRRKKAPFEPRRVSRNVQSAETTSARTDQDGSSFRDKCTVSPQKKSFDTMKEAESAARQAEREWNNKVRPYSCHACGKFHLTSNQER